MIKTIPILTAVLFCAVLPVQSQTFDERRIVVTGSAEIIVPADNITFSFTTRYESDDIDEAIRTVRKQAEEISSDLLKLSLTSENLSTGSFYSGKYRYSHDKKKKKRPEFYASLKTIVDIDSLDLLEPAIAAISKQRPFSVSDINYNLKNFEEHKLRALAKALEMAKIKANLLAECTGVKVGKVLFMDENKVSGYRMYTPNPFNASMQISSESDDSGSSFHDRSAKLSASVKLIVEIVD